MSFPHELGLSALIQLPFQEHPILEQALSDSEATRIQLQQENDNFREVLLSCAKSMQILLWSFEGPQVEVIAVHPRVSPILMNRFDFAS